MYSSVSSCAWDSGGVRKAQDTFGVLVLSWREQDSENRDHEKAAYEGGDNLLEEGGTLFTPQPHPCPKEFRGVEGGHAEGWGQNEPLARQGRSRKNCPLNKEEPASKVPVQGSREMGQREALPAAWLAGPLAIQDSD